MNQLDKIGATTTYLSLLGQLFTEGWGSEPQVTDRRCLYQRVSYKLSSIGDLAQAIKMHERHNKLCDHLLCRLNDVYFLRMTGALRAAIGELDSMFKRITRHAFNKTNINTITNDLVRVLLAYSEITYECGDIDASRSVDRLITKIACKRWNSSDTIFTEYLSGDTIGDQCYFCDKAIRMGKYAKASKRADLLWRIAERQGNEGHRIHAAGMQATALLKLGELYPAKERAEYLRLKSKAIGALPTEIGAAIIIAEVDLNRGSVESAYAVLDDIWELFKRAPYRLHHAEAMNVKTAIDVAAGNTGLAAFSARTAYELAWCDGPPYANHWELVKACNFIEQLGLSEACQLRANLGVDHPVLRIDLSLPESFWHAIDLDRRDREVNSR